MRKLTQLSEQLLAWAQRGVRGIGFLVTAAIMVATSVQTPVLALIDNPSAPPKTLGETMDGIPRDKLVSPSTYTGKIGSTPEEAIRYINNTQSKYYTNGAGQPQEIRTSLVPGDNNPAIVFINGGGWYSDSGTGDQLAPHANKRGYSTFVATYPLGPGGISSQYNDVMKAMHYIRDHAAEYRIDPSRIAIFGNSAGGSLAMRVAASGKSGAAVALGWSAPVNAYMDMLRSPAALAIGFFHSDCNPTSQQQLLDQVQTAEKTEEPVVLNARTLSTQELLTCKTDFDAMSPALYASVNSPPTHLAGYVADPVVDPRSQYQLRDRLRGMGIYSDVVLKPGEPNLGIPTPGVNHLGFDLDFVDPTLDFADRFLHPTAPTADNTGGNINTGSRREGDG